MRKLMTEELFKEMLHDYNSGYGLDDLSSKFEFENQTIQKWFNKNGIKLIKSKARHFSKDEMDNIISDYKNGMRPYELSSKYNRNSGTIISKLKTIGIYEYYNHRFTDKEIESIEKYYIEGNWEMIKNDFPNISKSSIHTKMSKLGIPMSSFHWNEYDVELLKKYYCDMYGNINDLIALFNNKYTYSAITSKANKIGLKTREFWNEKELSILKDNYSNLTPDEMVFLLPKRNKKTIINKANSLNLKSKVVCDTEFSEEDILFIKNNLNIYTDNEIGNIINRSSSSINSLRYRLGLLKTYEKSSYNDLSEYVKRNNLEWKDLSMKNSNYKCVLTGKRFDDIHHIHSLNFILNETLCNLNINIKKDIKEYNEIELKNILSEFKKVQNNYPLGVCLSKNIHVLFHKLYGFGKNNAEQWNEFVYNYKNNLIDVA